MFNILNVFVFFVFKLLMIGFWIIVGYVVKVILWYLFGIENLRIWVNEKEWYRKI